MSRAYVKALIAVVLAVALFASTVAIVAWAVHVQHQMEAASARDYSGLRPREVRKVKKEGNAELSKYLPMGLFTFTASILCGVQAIRLYNSARTEAEHEQT